MSLLGLLVLAAAPMAADQPASDASRGTGQCQAVRAVPVSRTRLDRSGTWSARQVMDLRFETRLRPGTEATEVEFRVYAPGGHLYRTLKVPVSVDVPENRGDLKRRRPPDDAHASMPVSGSGIVRNGLYGTWKVAPHLVGDARPCGRPFSFDLAP